MNHPVVFLSDAPNPVLVVRDQVAAVTGERLGRGCWVWCPGCDQGHRPVIADSDGHIPDGPVWEWDGDLETPTITPSLLVRGANPEPTVCHSFIRAGRWEFLEDSTHHLAGQTVDMVPVPDWMAR